MRRVGTGVCIAVAALVGVPASASASVPGSVLAGYAQSVRWSGWIDQGKGDHFDRVSAEWRVPSADCPGTRFTYSLTWIGLGGANENKLEQIGTETDCAPAGGGSSKGAPFAQLWWEVLPGSQQYQFRQMEVDDLVSASVTVKGGVATMSLHDLTQHWSFSKRMRPSKHQLTEGSADWIEEDPEICPTQVIVVSCPEKPFAHYRTVTFTHAAAGNTAGFTGSITDSHWFALRYGMLQGGVRQRLLSWPSPLRAGGTSFSVSRTNRKPPPEPSI